MACTNREKETDWTHFFLKKNLEKMKKLSPAKKIKKNKKNALLSEHRAGLPCCPVSRVSHLPTASAKKVCRHQTGYSDTIRRELIWENLSKAILDSRLTRTLIGGDMNAASPGSRNGYSQNPTTVRLRQSADDACSSSPKRLGAP